MNISTLTHHIQQGEKEFVAKGRHFKLERG